VGNKQKYIVQQPSDEGNIDEGHIEEKSRNSRMGFIYIF